MYIYITFCVELFLHVLATPEGVPLAVGQIEQVLVVSQFYIDQHIEGVLLD